MEVSEEQATSIAAAEADEASRLVRQHLCKSLGFAFRAVGATLWTGGWLLGGDRVAGLSPFNFGSDATVGLATVAQIGGELCSAAILLLESTNAYSAAALLRQLVEVEYLAWAFAEDKVEAERWMRSTNDERRKMWQPRHLRERSQGKFRSSDYGRHCELGGHPTPEGRVLLPHHQQISAALLWLELAVHGASAWEYFEAAALLLGWGDGVLQSVTEVEPVRAAIQAWRATDRFRRAAKTNLGWHSKADDE